MQDELSDTFGKQSCFAERFVAVTIKDIAQRAGVSHPTVSRALRGDPGVNVETTRRIRLAAQELGYVPSAAARSLKTNRTRAIGVLVHRVSDPFYSQVLDAIQDTLQEANYSIFLASTNNDRARERSLLRGMQELRVDGLILCSISVPPDYRRELDALRTPVVLIHNQAPEASPASIYHDDRDGARQLTRYLIDLGHKRIAYLGNAHAGRVNEERRAGVIEELHAAGLDIPPGYLVNARNGLAPAAVEPCSQLMTQDPLPTAIVCFDDLLAFGTMQCLAKIDRRVPQDFSITGFDNIPLAEFVNPPLTTFDQPKSALGIRAAEMLLKMMDAGKQDSVEPIALTLGGQLIARASTAPPRS